MTDSAFTLADGFEPVSVERWREQVEATLKGNSLAKRFYRTDDDQLTHRPLYVAADDRGPLGSSGSYPFVRGSGLPSWSSCPLISAGDWSQANAQLRQAVSLGAQSVWIAIDRVGRLGLSSHAAAPDRLPDGVVVETARQLAQLLDGVDLQHTAVHIDAGLNPLPLLGALALLAEQQGLPLAQLRGGVDCDPVSAVVRDGALPGVPPGLHQLLGDALAWSVANAPQLRTICVSTEPYHNRHATAAMELARMLTNGVRYLRWFGELGHSVDRVATQMRFVLAVTSDIFPEIAKLRAARWLWAHAVRAAGGSEAAQRMHLHVVGSWRTHTRRDPWVNLLRGTAQTFIGAVAGAQLVTIRPYDADYGCDGEDARRLASNTQEILREESYLAQVSDAAGGSYYVDTLTRELAAAAWAAFQTLEGEGDSEDELFDPQRAAAWQARAKRVQAVIATRKRPITGVSEFPLIDERVPQGVTLDPATFWAAVTARIDAELDSADSAPVIAAADATTQRGATVDAVIAALRDGATFDAVSAALFDTGPVTHPKGSVVVPCWRDAQQFESLRDRSDQITRVRGKRPLAFLANLGAIPQHKARSTFGTNLLAAGGIAVTSNDGFVTTDEVLSAFAESAAPLALICGSDEAYQAQVIELAQGLRRAGARAVGVVARPSAQDDAWRAAGVSDWIYIGCDAVALLAALLDAMGGEQ